MPTTRTRITRKGLTVRGILGGSRGQTWDVVVDRILLISVLVLTLAVLVVAIVWLPRQGPGITRRLEELVRDQLRQSTAEFRPELSAQRTELGEQLSRDRDERQTAQADLRNSFVDQLSQLRRSTDEKLEKVRETVHGEIGKLQQGNEQKFEQVRATVDSRLQETLEKLDKVRETVQGELEKLRQGNEQKLEQMRATVDEKLQSTLEKRLGESFKLVSDSLERVQKGLGEMQTLAQDVGGLKRVLTNVKNRGGWGEVLLEQQLEDVLTKDQYDENVVIRPNTGERVEFAIRLPGRDDGGPVWLPIDSKFPQESYERLLTAQERGEKSEIAEAERGLERAIVEQAKVISTKYIEPPHSTDFAILYLPTEGLFAEVMRRQGLASKLQNEHRVVVTGPTTLMSLLNSLQLGFRTLAIEKRSSEVWQVLSAAKLEFKRYGQVWQKLEKQLQTAQNTVTEAGRRTRAVERRLRTVELPQLVSDSDPGLADLSAEIEDDLADASLDGST